MEGLTPLELILGGIVIIMFFGAMLIAISSIGKGQG